MMSSMNLNNDTAVQKAIEESLQALGNAHNEDEELRKILEQSKHEF